MNQLYIICLVCLFYSSLFAQGEEGTETEPPFQAGITASADWGYRAISALNSDGEEVKGIKENSEFAAFGYTLGLRFRYELKNNLSLDAGLSFAARGYDGFGPFSNNGIQPLDQDIRNFYYFNYYELPFNIQYNFKSTTARPFVGLGLSLNYLSKAEHRTVYRDEIGLYDDVSKIYDKNDFSPLTTSLVVSSGINLKQSVRLFIRLEPTFTIQLNSLWRTKPYQERLYAGGLKISILMNREKLPLPPEEEWEQDEDWEEW